MSIALRQYKKVYDKVLLEFLKEGSIPSHQDIVARGGTSLHLATGSLTPVFEYRPQSKNSVFDIVLHNKSVQNIQTDLQILFEELTEVQNNALSRLLNAELFNSVHSHEIMRLNKELDALLFAIDGADDNFYAKFESFNDMGQTDQANSTPGVVDMAEGALALPISLKGSLKISLLHLASSSVPGFLLDRDDAEIIGTVGGTKYGNVFIDSIQPWAIECESAVNGPLELSFTFSLSKEEFINRITAISHSTKPQTIVFKTSVDNVNKKELKDYASGVLLETQYQEGSLDFEDRLVEFVHVILKKNASDSQVDDKFRYIFGLKNISIYTTGRAEQADYMSKSFDFSDSLTAVGKIGIKATETIPENTSIDWSVGMLDLDNNLVGEMMPITPQDRLGSSGPPKTINLQDVLSKTISFTTGAGDYSSILSYQGIDFYNIQTLVDEPVFGTAALYRGANSWFRDQSKAVNPVLIKDIYAPFSNGNNQQLYRLAQEIVNASKTSSSASGTVQSVVVLKNAPLYDSNKGHDLIPPTDINPEGNTDPTYAVYKATLSTTTANVTLGSKNFSAGGLVDLGVQNIIYSGPGDVVITNTEEQRIYIDGYDYLLQLDDDGKPTGVIEALEASANDPGLPKDLGISPYPTVSIQYSVDPDLTRFVSKITGKQVFFNLNVDNLPASQISIKYRHVTENVIKSSIKVKGFYGVAGNAQIFTQGKDYIYDSTTSQIQRLTTGSILPGSNVYIDYKFNDLDKNLNQFFLWAFIGGKDSKVIDLERLTDIGIENKLSPNPDFEEELLAQIPGAGLINLTNAVTWPEMNGWIQFVVRSVPPENLMSSSKEPLIHQVIKLKDQLGNYVFVGGGKYFEEITAIKEPLTQVAFNYLKTNTLKKDDNSFAIKLLLLQAGNQYQVVINSEPNTSEKLYQFGPTGKETVQDGPDGLYAVDESWKLTWVTKQTTADVYTKIAVAAKLSRSPDASGGNITPKAYDYIVKTGY